METIEKIALLEKRLYQLNQRIQDEKTYQRTKENRRKKSLGKMLIMAGANKYYDQTDVPFNLVMAMGGLFYIVGIHQLKLSILLGACYLIFQELDNDEEGQKETEKLGNELYDEYIPSKERKSKNNSLDYPFNFFLGIIIKAKQFIHVDKNIDLCHETGDKIFIDFRMKKLSLSKSNDPENNPMPTE